MATVYIAGPQVFTPSGRVHVREEVIPALEAAGHDPVFPAELGDEDDLRDALSREGEDRVAALADWSAATGRRNREAIERADAVLASLDGADVDSGTAAEIGYAAALGIPVVGYRTDSRESGENEAVAVNLQVEAFIADSGGRIVVPEDAAATDRHRGHTGEPWDAVAAELDRALD